MDKGELSKRLAALRGETRLFEIVIHILAWRLGAPRLIRQSAEDVWFRYHDPDQRHFCLLKAARATSAMNASIGLASGGYSQEIGVLLRVILESIHEIEFVLLSNIEGEFSEALNYVNDFFADIDRHPKSKTKKPKLSLSKIRERLGVLHSMIADSPVSAEELSQMMYSTHRAFSKYVHGGYREVMDMYGGHPARFHMTGMAGTPKDDENVAVLEAAMPSLDICFRFVVKILGLTNDALCHPELKVWLQRR